MWMRFLTISLLVLLCATAEAAVLTFTDATNAAGMTAMLRGRGCTFFDLEEDGDLDLMVWNDLTNDDLLYVNSGAGVFMEMASSAGVSGVNTELEQEGMIADFSNDGIPDIYVPSALNFPDTGRNRFHVNVDGQLFTELGEQYGIRNNDQAKGPSAVDINLDGYLDFYVGTILRNLDKTPHFFINQGGQGFTDEWEDRGFDYRLNDHNHLWFDWGDDGDFDLFVGAFFSSVTTDWNDRIYENDGTGHFTWASGAINSSPEVTTGAQLADLDSDGDLEIFVLRRETSNVVWDDQGDGTFINIAPTLGMEMSPEVINGDPEEKMRAIIADFDNDMDLDVFIAMLDLTIGGEPPDQLWLNEGGTYVNRAVEAGISHIAVNAWSCATGDVNGDGFLDIYVVNDNDFGTRDSLWLNNGNSNHWLEIDPVGTTSSRDGIGLKAWLTAGGVTQVQELYYTTTRPSRLHFGLASNEVVSNLTLRWPNGLVENYTDLPADQVFRPVEGTTIPWNGDGLMVRGVPHLETNP